MGEAVGGVLPQARGAQEVGSRPSAAPRAAGAGPAARRRRHVLLDQIFKSERHEGARFLSLSLFRFFFFFMYISIEFIFFSVCRKTPEVIPSLGSQPQVVRLTEQRDKDVYHFFSPPFFSIFFFF